MTRNTRRRGRPRRAEAQKHRIGRRSPGPEPALGRRIGAFGGMVRIPPGMRSPTLVLSTDGVGTKVLVALQAGRYDTWAKIWSTTASTTSWSTAPRRSRSWTTSRARAGARIRSPGSWTGSPRDAARTGWRWRWRDGADARPLSARHLRPRRHHHRRGREQEALHGDAIRPGDVLLGYASTGLHTNGYTLARRIVFERMGSVLEIGWVTPASGGRRAPRGAPELLAAIRPVLRGFTAWRTSPAAGFRETWCGCYRPVRRRVWTGELAASSPLRHPAAGRADQHRRDARCLQPGHRDDRGPALAPLPRAAGGGIRRRRHLVIGDIRRGEPAVRFGRR
jgi:hypothetical protein